ncbi:MAG: peptidase M22 [Clostridia bacterium]|nr:peptidase M22 [Clostridia bacterium]
MSDKIYLGIDTSNYTTSVAVYSDNIEINCKKLLTVKPGEIGVRQSEAVFQHVRQLSDVFSEADTKLKNLGFSMRDISGVGVSVSPRTAEGSYMPCFLTGKMLAENLSLSLSVPCYHFSHQQGHIAAALYSAGRLDLLDEKIIAYHLSGGTSEGLIVTPNEHGLPEVELVCGSNDLKAGQAIDRIGVAMGLPFPAGKYLDELASKSTKRYKHKPAMKGADFSLSGIQNKCEKMLRENESQEDIAKYCLGYIISSIDASLANLKETYGDLPILFSGGVSSNSLLREHMTNKYGALFAKPAFSADNAYGVAVLASKGAGI